MESAGHIKDIHMAAFLDRVGYKTDLEAFLETLALK
jgi:hypothetical protein